MKTPLRGDYSIRETKEDCPKCGYDHVIIHKFPKTSLNYRPHYSWEMYCVVCGTTSGKKHDMESAVGHWYMKYSR